jgi:hypothetical protein
MSSQPFGAHQPAAGDIGRRRIDDPQDSIMLHLDLPLKDFVFRRTMVPRFSVSDWRRGVISPQTKSSLSLYSVSASGIGP